MNEKILDEIKFTPKLINKIYSKLPDQLQLMFGLIDKESAVLIIVGVINAWEQVRKKKKG